jgi:hypothetical protein
MDAPLFQYETDCHAGVKKLGDAKAQNRCCAIQQD